MKALLTICTLLSFSSAALAKIPDVYAKLKDAHIVRFTEDELTFKGSGNIRLFLATTDTKSTWIINGKTADFFPLIAQDCLFKIRFAPPHASVSPRDPKWLKYKEQIKKVGNLLSGGGAHTFSIKSVDMTLSKGLVSEVRGTWIQIGSPLSKDRAEKDKEEPTKK